jgi:hypothetical protein
MVVFATNPARRTSAVPSGDGIEVRYLASAEKPLRIAPYRGLPRPGAVAGDQLPTDGVLAYRLRFTFLHYVPRLSGVPLGPGLMHRWGELVRPLLFRRSATPQMRTLPSEETGFIQAVNAACRICGQPRIPVCFGLPVTR